MTDLTSDEIMSDCGQLVLSNADQSWQGSGMVYAHLKEVILTPWRKSLA